MWIFTPQAFLSIVAHRSLPGHLMVRARFAGDIQRVFPQAKVQRTPAGDYLFRAVIRREDVAEALALHAGRMEYTNVKGAIAREEHLRHDAMLGCWEAMHYAQRMADRPADNLPTLGTGQLYQHTTARGEPREVYVHLVQAQLEPDTLPRVTLEYRRPGEHRGKFHSYPLGNARRALRGAELLR